MRKRNRRQSTPKRKNHLLPLSERSDVHETGLSLTVGSQLNVAAEALLEKLILCHHCVKPACMAACPTGAIYRHGENEPVLYDDEKCNSCFECVEACPFGAISVKPEGKKVLKCDLCIERLAQHKLPACVAACPTAALVYGDSEDSTREKRKEK